MTDFSFTDAGAFSTDQNFSGGTSGNPFTPANIVTGLSGLTGAAASFISGQANSAAAQASAQGYTQEADLYNQAATLAGYDVGITAAEGATAVAQRQRQIEMTEATATAATFGGGLVGDTGNPNTNPNQYTGTAGDILRSSQQQAALIIGQQQLQTQLQENEFTQMQTAFEAQAAGATAAATAAKAQASAASAGGILGALGSVVGVVGKFL